jgi:hypothetical protein
MDYSIEAAYNAVAAACDAVPAAERELFLAKLALVLAERCGDLEVLRASLEIAQRDLAPAADAPAAAEIAVA